MSATDRQTDLQRLRDNRPAFVIYEGKRRMVIDAGYIDADELGYKLRMSPKRPESIIWARLTDCAPWSPRRGPRRRKLKDGRMVLEFCGGAITVRRARSRKRFAVTLEQIYDFAVRLSVLKDGRIPKALKARRLRR